MFWSKKKESKRRERARRDSEENEFGIKIDKGQDDKKLEAELKRLAGVQSFPEDDLNLNEGEEDVESELLRLIGGGKGRRQPKKSSQGNSEEPLGDISDLTAVTDLEDEDVEVDENDPELLGELLELTNPGDDEIVDEVGSDSEPESEGKPSNGDSDVITTIKERLKMYKTAEAKAMENRESSRARRFARGIKTIEDLLKRAKAGKAVSPDELPPVIALNLKPAPPPPPPPPPPAQPDIPEDTLETPEEPENSFAFNSSKMQNSNTSASESGDVLTTLMNRLKLYQTAEAKAKESGETTRARRFSRGIKTLQGLIKQAQAGKPIASEDIPPEVAVNLKPAPPPPPTQPLSQDNNPDKYEENVENEVGNVSLTSPPSDAESNEVQEQERNIMDVLSERLQMYKMAETKAKENGETSRARRFNRGIKTLQDLTRQATAGRPVAPDDIPPVIALNLKPAPLVAVNVEEPKEPAVERADLVRSSDVPERPLSFAPVDDVDVDVDVDIGEELDEVEEEMATTVLEGMEQRARLYRKFQAKASEEGNLALADQSRRVVEVYLNAIKTYKKGGFVDVEKLPNPRGCPPIPIPFFVP